MRSRTLIICFSLLAAALASLPAATSAAKKKSTPAPQITRVTPMRLAVGQTLVIRGRNFKPSRRSNTVIFRSGSGRTAFAKPRSASRTKLVVRVPAAVAQLVSRSAGQAKPTRFKLRVLAGKFSGWTSRRLSPVILAPSGSAGAAACGTGNDWDGDLLSNSYEKQIGTDPCRADTDGDGVPDGYEQQSAIDLNHHPRTPPLPYPGKRPYPNALDPSDANTDHDGDGMTLHDEYLMWSRYSADGQRRIGRPTTLSALLYSDGLQKSIDPAPGAPAPGTLDRWVLDLNNDGTLTDDERDADGDGLSNWDEAHGRMLQSWWPAQHSGTVEPLESAYPLSYLDNSRLPSHDAFVDPDVNGDGVPDGADDYDHDGLSNAFELRRPATWQADISGSPPANSWAYVDPFNPCKPFNSERCQRHPNFGYAQGDTVTPVGPPPPAGYPDVHPVTPAG